MNNKKAKRIRKLADRLALLTGMPVEELVKDLKKNNKKGGQ